MNLCMQHDTEIWILAFCLRKRGKKCQIIEKFEWQHMHVKMCSRLGHRNRRSTDKADSFSFHACSCVCEDQKILLYWELPWLLLHIAPFKAVFILDSQAHSCHTAAAVLGENNQASTRKSRWLWTVYGVVCEFMNLCVVVEFDKWSNTLERLLEQTRQSCLVLSPKCHCLKWHFLLEQEDAGL